MYSERRRVSNIPVESVMDIFKKKRNEKQANKQTSSKMRFTVISFLG
jgi:hypothetical protein